MPLHDQLMSDLGVFLADFGEEVEIDGIPMIALVDDEGQGSEETREGVNVRVMTLTVREDQLARPKAGRTLTVNGETWTVSKTQGQQGFLEIQIFKELS